MADIEFETEMWVDVVDGKPVAPRVLDCFNCGEPMRRRPGDAYRCSGCGAFTTLDMNPENARTKRKDIKVGMN